MLRDNCAIKICVSLDAQVANKVTLMKEVSLKNIAVWGSNQVGFEASNETVNLHLNIESVM